MGCSVLYRPKLIDPPAKQGKQFKFQRKLRLHVASGTKVSIVTLT